MENENIQENTAAVAPIVGTTAFLPRWSKKVLRGIVTQYREGPKEPSLSRHVHETLYEVLEGVVRRLVRGFAMERQTCPASMGDVDVIEHVVRYDPEIIFLLSELPMVRARWNEWKKASDHQELKALPHYRMKTSLKRAIRDARKELGSENPRVMMDLVSFILFLVEAWIARVAMGLGKLQLVTHRVTVSLADVRLVLRLMLPGQEWALPTLTKEYPVKPKKVKQVNEANPEANEVTTAEASAEKPKKSKK